MWATSRWELFARNLPSLQTKDAGRIVYGVKVLDEEYFSLVEIYGWFEASKFMDEAHYDKEIDGWRVPIDELVPWVLTTTSLVTIVCLSLRSNCLWLTRLSWIVQDVLNLYEK